MATSLADRQRTITAGRRSIRPCGPHEQRHSLRQHDAPTKDYIARRVAEGKTQREAVRLLKRYLARHLYRALDHQAALTT